jgi:hypothetical protein
VVNKLKKSHRMLMFSATGLAFCFCFGRREQTQTKSSRSRPWYFAEGNNNTDTAANLVAGGTSAWPHCGLLVAAQWLWWWSWCNSVPVTIEI